MLSKSCFTLQHKTAGQTATVKYDCATHVVLVRLDSHYVRLTDGEAQATATLLNR